MERSRGMRAVILAAGKGTRLAGASGGLPKILLDVGGATLLERHFRSLAEIGLAPEMVTVVGGWCGEQVRASLPDGCTYLSNPEYESTGSLASFMLCNDSTNLIVIDGDLIWDPAVCMAAIGRPGDVVIPFDSDSMSDGSLKVKVSGYGHVELSRDISEMEASGEALGIFLIRERALPHIREAGWRLLTMSGKRAGFDEVVAELAQERVLEIRSVDVTGIPWEGIDTETDLMRARREFQPSGDDGISGPRMDWWYEDRIRKWAYFVEKHASPMAAASILRGMRDLFPCAGLPAIADWFRSASLEMEEHLDADARQRILTCVSCEFPGWRIEQFREMYRSGTGVAGIVGLMNADRATYGPTELRGNIIETIKAPFDREGLRTASSDADRRRFACRCPFAKAMTGPVPESFCNCGLGWDKMLWEGILGVPVDVRLLESVMQGGDRCRFEITIPHECLEGGSGRNPLASRDGSH